MYGLLGYDNIGLRYNYLKIWNLRVQKNLNIEKIAFKVVQMKYLAMHITNQKLRLIDNFDPYNVFLAIAINIPLWLKTGFVVQGHIKHMVIYVF